MGGMDLDVGVVTVVAQGALFGVLFVIGIGVGKMLERRAAKKRAALEKEK